MTAATVLEHVQVAFRLAKRDPAAIDDIANTQAAFWYSFQGAVITLPMMLITIVLEGGGVPGLLGLLGEVGLFAVGWLLYPVVMLEIVPLIDRAQHYCRYMAASNWCNVLEDGVLTLIVVLRALNIIPESLGGLAFFACVIWVFSYQFFVIRNGLKVDAGIAAMLIGVRLLLAVGLFMIHSAFGG